MAEFVGLVCKKCLEADPSRVELLTRKCFQESLHAGSEPIVKAVRTAGSRFLEQCMRPMPRLWWFHGKFVLCNGKRCKGERCTYPHSVEERDAWNAEKFGRSRGTNSRKHSADIEGISSPERRTRPMPRVWFHGEFELCNGKHYKEERCTYPHSAEERDAWNAEKFGRSQGSPRHSADFEGITGPEWPSLHSAHSARASTTRPQQKQSAQSEDLSGDPKSPPHSYAAKETEFSTRIQEDLQIEDVQVELTQANYKEKFHKLLCWEEKAHIEILGKKCDGHYTLILHQAGLKQPPWMKKESNRSHRRFGYLVGLNGDQIAYATQASEGAFIVHEGTEIKVNVLMENFNHVEERMYIALDKDNLDKLEKLKTLSVSKAPFKSHLKLKVEFELKHSYFNNLHVAVERLSPEVIARIVPEVQTFATNRQIRVPEYERYCSEDQLNALQAIATCPSNGPPIVIAGAFGTGKSHILAIAARYFQKEKSNQPARVLVCTQQRTSADTFLDCYLSLMDPQEEEVYQIRGPYGARNPKLEPWYRSVSEFRSYIERSSYRNRSKFLIITTCMTALQLAKIVPHGFFTHILLDEGAQMREPEAIAPLSMAGKNTKIVIAGDQNQVGPAMLVLGDEAQENGLAVSLLERLHRLYGTLGEAAADHCATLVTNYRCHGGILTLAEKLFYDLPLQCKVLLSTAHPAAQYQYPLQFCCSSIDDKMQLVGSTINECEATITLDVITEFAKQWPNASWGPLDPFQMCVMSPSRSQLTMVNRLIHDRRLYKLQQLRRLPTYSIQGHEFRALFLSTSEPTDKDGATRNPTKSMCDRYVFNTAITRAQSLVVAVGNPFTLLWMERHMVQKYGEKGKCWSNYLKFCLDHGTLTIHDSLQVPEAEKNRCIQKLQKLVENQLIPTSCDNQSAKAAAVASLHHSRRKAVQIESERKIGAAMKVNLQIRPSPSDSETILLTEGTPHLQSKAMSVSTKEEASHSSQLKDLVSHPCRLETQYRVIKVLGEGGFGVVYCVRYELDDTDYAVKIIKLPKKKSDQERVVREVRALAKLNHPKIVRYYTSWVEDAPPDWHEKEIWKALRSSESVPCAELSPYPSGTVSDASASSVPVVSSSSTTPSHSMMQSDFSVGAQRAGSSDSFTVKFQNDSDTTQQSITDELQSRMTATAGNGTFNPLPKSLTCLYIQTELCQKKTLRDWLQDNIETRKRQTVINFFTQVLEAVVYIHQKGYLHRDLKPSNIFFSLEDDSVKVGDFGLVTGTSAPNPPSTQRNGSGLQSHSKEVGTHFYMSPEQKCGGKYDEKVDMYALGVILFELNCPFRTTFEKNKVLSKLQDDEIFPPNYEDKLPVEAAMVRSLLEKQPSKRPSATEVFNGAQLKGLRKAVKKSKKSDLVPVF